MVEQRTANPCDTSSNLVMTITISLRTYGFGGGVGEGGRAGFNKVRGSDHPFRQTKGSTKLETQITPLVRHGGEILHKTRIFPCHSSPCRNTIMAAILGGPAKQFKSPRHYNITADNFVS